MSVLTDHSLAILWWKLPQQKREAICKAYGFGDYRTYASYRWGEFQPHTREALAPLLLDDKGAE